MGAEFLTGGNLGGYDFNSIQLAMTDAIGSPSGFTAMIYGGINNGTGVSPGSSLATLTGSANPSTAGIYTYTPTADLVLLPSTAYFIVLTAGTFVTDGAYEWSFAGLPERNAGWGAGNSILRSANGLNWGFAHTGSAQYAITATPIPEPGILSLLGLSGVAFVWHRKREKRFR